MYFQLGPLLILKIEKSFWGNLSNFEVKFQRVKVYLQNFGEKISAYLFQKFRFIKENVKKEKKKKKDVELFS